MRNFKRFSRSFSSRWLTGLPLGGVGVASAWMNVKEDKRNTNSTQSSKNESPLPPPMVWKHTEVLDSENEDIDETIKYPVSDKFSTIVKPGSFKHSQHYYEKVLNAQLHPMVASFLNLSLERIAERYCHMHPSLRKQQLLEVLKYKPRWLRWAGADLFVVTAPKTGRHLCVIETNTCPSGQKSMPLLHDQDEQGGYGKLVRETFHDLCDNVHPDCKDGKLAVIYDKNPMENTGYAAALADAFNEPVYMAKFYHNDGNPPVKFENGIMYLRTGDEEKEEWVPIRAAFRYVTQKPWTRIPLKTKTKILNPVISCLAGGRNKNLADKAYEVLNTELRQTPGLEDLAVITPETINDVPKAAIPLHLKTYGGVGVVKNPYSNAGQGVWTITNDDDFNEFQNDPTTENYDRFIVQSLIGNAEWSSTTTKGMLYHVGTIPDKQMKTYAADIRMQVQYTANGWKPLAVYSRRAKRPLAKNLKKSKYTSWDMLGTNLSEKVNDTTWTTDTSRLILMDSKDFNKLGIAMDDLIVGYVQTVLAVVAIDRMCCSLVDKKDNFNFELFQGLNDDKALINEILQAKGGSNANEV